MGVYSGGKAFGDIYQIPTSAIDGIAAKIYREQQQRELEKRQADKALDDEFGRNVAGVKSADIGEITQAYNDFKQAHIALQKKGAKATPQDQMNVMIKKADAFSKIGASKEDKERIKGYVAEVKADRKGVYDPNAHAMINDMLNTPTSKRNLDNDANIKYKYAMPNIDKEILNAAGKAQDYDVFVGADDKDPLKDKFETVKKINPPNTFYNTLYTGLGARSDNQNFTRSVMDSMTDDEKDKLRTQFELKIQDPRFKELYGEVKPFPASAANTELGQAVALKTMEAFVNLPIVGEEKRVLNADRNKTATQKFAEEQQARAFKQQKRMAYLTDNLIKGRMKLAEGYKQAMVDYRSAKDAQQQEGVLNTVINQSYDNGDADTVKFIEIGNKKYTGRIVDVPKKIQDDYIIDKGYSTERKPDFWYMTDDKKSIIPVYTSGEKKPGNYLISENITSDTKPVDVRNYKIPLGQMLLTGKERGGEVVDEDFFSDYKPATNKTTKEVKKTTSTSSKQSIPGWNN